MKRTIVFGMALAVGLAAAAEAGAQVQMGIGGGPSFPVGDLADEADPGFNVQVGARVGIPLFPVGVRVDGLYNRWSGHDGNSNVLGGTAAAELSLPGIIISPYFLAGPGYYRASVAHGDHQDEESGVGYTAGLGARFGLLGYGVFAEARLHHMPVHGESIQFIPVTFGINF